MKKIPIKMSPSARGSLWKDERGMSTVEYVILLAVIVMGAVTIWMEIGDHIIAALGGSRDQVMKIPTVGP